MTPEERRPSTTGREDEAEDTVDAGGRLEYSAVPPGFPHGGYLNKLGEEAGVAPERILDFSASINPLGFPEWLRPLVSASLSSIVHYPDPHAESFLAAVARATGVEPARLVAGNGSTELIRALCRAFVASRGSTARFDLPRSKVARFGGPPSSASGIPPSLASVSGSPRWMAPGPGIARTRAVVLAPSYRDYEDAAALAGMGIDRVPLKEESGFRLFWDDLALHAGADALVFIGHPNNPTGLGIDPSELASFAAEHPDTLFAVDAAFAEFIESDIRNLMTRSINSPNVVVIASLTKILALPGLRIGYLVAAPDLAERIRAEIPPWSVNGLAQAVGARAMADRAFIERTRTYVAARRAELCAQLAALPELTVFPSDANFLLCRLDGPGASASVLRRALLHDDGEARRIAIRDSSNFPGLDPRFFRVAVRSHEENAALVAALSRAFGIALDPVGHHALGQHGESDRRRVAAAAGSRAPLLRPRRVPALMIQGTSSNAGKSLVAAALCRILLQDGCRVAPFKSQNMSLNSFVTRDGGEMARAQVVQAQACRLDPDVRMNPILLKPIGANGSQVIVMGRPVGAMTVNEYIAYKPSAFAAAKKAYDDLAAEHDVVIIEGAGSPGEVNLKRHDIANMAMARHADAVVLLVGDIDRGGVFASFVGTMEVLDEEERSRIFGYIVNKFRGQADLLGPALEHMRAHTGREVLGVVPWLDRLHLPEEDSVGHKCGAFDRFAGRDVIARSSGGASAADIAAAGPGDGFSIPFLADSTSRDFLDLALIDLPHIANLSDFDPFRVEPDVLLRVVRRADELGEPDAILVPGSRNVPGDLAELRAREFDTAIIRARERGCEIIGVCAGMQMLGRELRDPHALESFAPTVPGLGLLDLTTTFEPEKTLKRVAARHASGAEIVGYEIHHGRTESAEAVCIEADGAPLGFSSADGRVWGTYVHGVFDADAFRRHLLDRLRSRRGLPPIERTTAYDLEPALDRLADAVRASVRLDAIKRLLHL